MTGSRPKRKPQPPVPLSAGARVGPYEVRNVLGMGQYGIVYRVVDHEEEVELAVREYLPPAWAWRNANGQVVPRTPDDAEAFTQGLRFFINEGRLLSQFDHPAMVKVRASWEADGTAYMAMTLVHGRNLCDTLQARWKPPNEAALRAISEPLLGALEKLHEAGIQHRDIAPENIVLDPRGRPVLLDLDSPRRVSSARGETGPGGPRDGFAAPELYGTGDGRVRGPWTDFYALGATLYFLIAGKPPPAPAQRRPDDRLAMSLQTPKMRHSLEFLGVVDWMMALAPADRPQSVAAVRDALAGQGLPAHLAPTRKLRWRFKWQRLKLVLWLILGLVALALLVQGARWAHQLPMVKDWLLRFF